MVTRPAVPTIPEEFKPTEEEKRKVIFVPSESAAATVERMNRLMAQQQELVRERALRPQTFTAEEVSSLFKAELPAGWTMTIKPSVEGEVPGYTFNTPEGWQITEADTFISPAGREYTEEEIRALPPEQIPQALFKLEEVVFPELVPVELTQEQQAQYDAVSKALEAVLPDMEVEALAAMEDDSPELMAFYQGLLDIGRTPETEGLLLALGATPEEVDELYRVPTLVKAIFPEMTADEYVRLVTDDWEGFIKRIIEGGRNEDKEELLAEMGLTFTEIDSIFKPWYEQLPPEGVDIVMDIAGIRTLVHIEVPNLQVWARGILIGRFNVRGEFDPTDKGMEEYLNETYLPPTVATRDQIEKDYNKALVVIDKEYTDVADWTVTGWEDRRAADPERVKEWTDAKAQAWEDYQEALRPPWSKQFNAGVGDTVSAAAGVTRWMGKDGIADRLSKYSEKLQAQAPPDYMGEFEWSMMFNPRFYSTRVLRALPFTLSLAPAAIIGAYIATHIPITIPYLGAYGKLVLGSLGAAALSRPLESAFEAGITYDEVFERTGSKEEADKAASKVFLGNLALAGWDAVQFAVAFIPLPGAAQASRFWRMAMVGGKLAIVGLTEAGEEAYQEVLQKWAKGEEIKLDAEMQQVMAIGGIFGIGLGGVGTTFNIIKGYTRENLSPTAEAALDKEVADFKTEGLTQEQAELRAYDNLAKTEEGGKATTDAVERAKQEGFDREAQRYAEIVEARVVARPEAVPTEVAIEGLSSDITPLEGKTGTEDGGRIVWSINDEEVALVYLAFEREAATYDISGDIPANTAVLDLIEIFKAEWQKKGLGRYILGNIEQRARTAGMERIYATNVDNESFFAHMGYKLERGKVWSKDLQVRPPTPAAPPVAEIVPVFEETAIKNTVVALEGGVSEAVIITQLQSPRAAHQFTEGEALSILDRAKARMAIPTAPAAEPVVAPVEPEVAAVDEDEIATVHNKEGGVTYNISQGQGNLVGKSLYAVSIYPESGEVIKGEQITGEQIKEYIEKNKELLNQPRNSLGTWYDAEANETDLDVVVTIPSKVEALELGREHEQKAIFDLERMKEIPVTVDLSLEDFRLAVIKEIGIPVDYKEMNWRDTTYRVQYKQPFIEVGTQDIPQGVNRENFIKLITLHEAAHSKLMHRKPSLAVEIAAWKWAADQAIKFGVDFAPAAEIMRIVHPEYGEAAILHEVTRVEIETAAEPPAVEVLPEAEDEVRRQLGELQKMSDYWRDKRATSEETKVALAKFVRQNLPISLRGRYVTAIARVRTDAQLGVQVARVQTFAEQSAQKMLKGEIHKEIRKAQARVKDHILKGRFTPEVQRRLDVITHNLEIDRDVAREQMAGNISKYEDGTLSYEEMLIANESLNFAGINGMSAHELSNTLEYIKILETIGRSERQAKQEAATERITALRTDIMGILTGGQGLKGGIGAVPRAQLAAKPGWLDTFVNWQYSLDNLADKLSKFDTTSLPYQSELSKFVAKAHRATNRQNIGTTDSFKVIKTAVQEVYGVKGTRDINQVLNGLNEEVELGIFDYTEEYKANHPDATTFNLVMTRDEMISKYMQIQDATLNNTFVTGMGWSQSVRDAIDKSLTAEEKALARKIFEIYEEYYATINPIYQELYNVDMPHNTKYSPIRRDLTGDIAENVLTFQDNQGYAAVINGSIKARQANIRPLRFNGATQILSNHITQMEHFKAWATTMRDFRRVFGNTEIRMAIEQYHGRGIGSLMDKFLNQLARGGIETAATNRVADYLRKSFTKSILAIKPVVGMKQIPSLFAYITDQQMGTTGFFSGIADFWRAPIKNFKFLYANSEGYRARVSQGFERDIRAARERHGINKISGRGSFTDWFLVQIRLGDTMAVTQGMWAKYQSGLKAGLSTEEAIAEAEDLTSRTQPSFGIDTLSALQNGGSFLKLMTMFQNQPNKYFRMEADNLRNFRYGRGSRVKAASTIILVHCVLPMIFQFIADAFQWKEERQARAAILGSLNFILIGGQLVQSMWGWLTGEPFDWQVSPVLSTGDEIQRAFFKAKQMVDRGQDPYKEITCDDVAQLLEYLAKITGQLLGLPTPYIVQVEKGIRMKIKEGEEITIKDFLFSQWAMQPPRKDAEEKVEDASLELGEVREGEEDKPLTEKEPKIYTTVEWFREIGRIYSKTLPQDVLDDPDASRESKAWAEGEMAWSKAGILPNLQLYKISTEEGDDNIINYYEQWKARERIDNLPELGEFDKLYPKAYLGNVSRQQYNLLVKYLEAEDKDAFLERHEELRVNPRNEWLKDPKNARAAALLALRGQAKILSEAVYKEFKKLLNELDIPEDAIPANTMPPEKDIQVHFEYEDMVDEETHSSWEAQLLKALNGGYCEWRDPPLKIPDTPIAALELKTAGNYHQLYDKIEEIRVDETLDDVIKDKDGLTQKDRAIQTIKQSKIEGSKYEYREIEDMVKALEQGTNDIPTPDNIVKAWAKRGLVIDEYGATSSEAILWLLDNQEVYDWAVENDLLEENREENRTRESTLRISVDFAEEDDWYNEGIPEKHEARNYLNKDARDAAIAEERAEYLDGKPEYEKARYKVEAYSLKDKSFNPFPEELIDEYVDWKTNPDLKKPDDWDDNLGWYEDDWYLQEHPELHQALVDYGNYKELRDFTKVPTKEVFGLYREYLEITDKDGKADAQARLNFRHEYPELERWLVDHKDYKPVEDRWTAPHDPALANRKYWLDQARHYRGLLDSLGISGSITPEELTDAQAKRIQRAIERLF